MFTYSSRLAALVSYIAMEFSWNTVMYIVLCNTYCITSLVVRIANYI